MTGLDAPAEVLGCCGCLGAVGAAGPLAKAWLLPSVLLQGLTGGAVLPLAAAAACCLGEVLLLLTGGVCVLLLLPCFSICSLAFAFVGGAELQGAPPLSLPLTYFELSIGLQIPLDLGCDVPELHASCSSCCKDSDDMGLLAALLGSFLGNCSCADSASARGGLNADPADLKPSAWRCPVGARGGSASAALLDVDDNSLTACLLLAVAPLFMLAEPALCRLTELASCAMLPALLLTDRLESALATRALALGAPGGATATVCSVCTCAAEVPSNATSLHELASLASVEA